MMAFGVSVVALVGGSFGWVPHLLCRFELTADVEEVEKELCQRYLALDEAALQSVLQPSSQPTQRRMLNQAQAFALDFSMVEWVETLNQEQGLAPSVAELIKKRRLSVEESQAGVWGEFTAAPSSGKSAEYKWTSRLRQAWSMTLGKTEEREVVTVPVMRQKVSFQPWTSPVFLMQRMVSCMRG